ncbi:hypothetical protein [Prevotella pectinovora]|uniref:hypothetical protein n=1 Tax=Prevotella pectinovora TaxID=1602169 RepID=UPI00307948EF
MGYILKTKHLEILDLLKKFQDRKSGKIVESRKILRDSFYFLRRKDKRLVLRAFLNGSKTDMDFASLKMQYRWFPELMPLLKERWLSVQTKEVALFIIHNTSKDYVLSQKHLLIKTLGYYQYLAETAPWGEEEVVSPSLNLPDYALSRAEYCRACFLYGIPIDKNEILKSLFLNIIEYLGYEDSPDWGRSYRQPRNIAWGVPDWRKEFSPVLYLDFLLNQANVGLIIQTMRDFNMKKEMEFFWEWKEKMIDSFQCYSSFDDVEDFCKYIVTKVRDNFPPQYSYMLPKREKEEPVISEL